MSYSASAALQSAIYTQLTSAPALAGVSVVDAMPPGTPVGTFVLLGSEVAIDQSDKTGAGAEHRVEIAVISDAAGFLPGKTIAAAISDALVDANLTLAVGRLVSLTFTRATARRLDDGTARRIDLQFRARVEI
jgi:hypothetical protein